ncbi:tail fiber domain-containing protein [Pseudomonas sp. TWI929]|uniref:tail fiber domain-containing protein n=1 Tax=Pseudomonas sp. TWI929 TaxID=3136795 RepID=UPI00320BA2C2
MKLSRLFAALTLVAAIGLSGMASADLGAKCCPFSDARLKTDIKELLDSTDTLMKIHGVRMKWIESGREDIGVLAQDVQKVYPELVHEKDGLLTVDYEKLVAPLIEAVRELDQRVTALEKAGDSH